MKGNAAADHDILASLNGIVEMQRTIRRNALDLSVQTGLIFLRVYYQRLPSTVARRLTEIDSRIIDSIPCATEENWAGAWWHELGNKVAGDAAFAQAIRAANSYRKKLGISPLGEDGKPEDSERGYC